MTAVGPVVMDESTWDDPPSLIDESELSTSALDSSHASLVDEDDGEMELSSSLNLSSACASDSDDDRTPLFPKSSGFVAPTAVNQPQLSHLTERQQLAYLMRTAEQQQRRSRPASSSAKQQPQAKRSASPSALPPPHPPHHPIKPSKPQPTDPTTTITTTKPSILTHDKKRRRTTTTANTAQSTTTTTSTIDPDDSHLYTVQRLPPAATAPIPLPTPPQYATWTADQQQRWDRISDQPGAYYYRYTAPGVAVRTGEWTAEEVELLLHLLVCHPVRAGGRSGGSESDWGLFSMNVVGRVGLECEKKWRELAAAGKLNREDRFDYMQWYERQRQSADDRVKAEIVQPKRRETVEPAEVSGSGRKADAVQAVAGAATLSPTRPTKPVVVNRKRVAAPSAQPTVAALKSEVAPAAQASVQKVEVVSVKRQAETAAVKAESATVAAEKESATVNERVQRREKDRDGQPPRKKTVRFQPTPLPKVEAANAVADIAEINTHILDDSPIVPAPPLPATTVNRQTPPTRVSIPLLRPAAEDESSLSALWPPRPPRMPIAASPVPSTITAPSASAHCTRRLDTSQLTVSSAHSHTNPVLSAAHDTTTSTSPALSMLTSSHYVCLLTCLSTDR